MGLAEPRKRLKLSHDPRNLAWSSQSYDTSYGHRMMTQQGWTEGQALGARDTSPSTTATRSWHHHSGLATDAERLAAARIGILFKDDNLGLGAKRKGGERDIEAQRTGLDAFQGLLGRLNGKGEAEVRELERKGEERRLEMFFRGRWGGMVFVRGGILVGSVGKEGEKTEVEQVDGKEIEAASQDQTPGENQEREQRRRSKEEKRQRKEERRKRKEEKALRKAAKTKSTSRDKADIDSGSTSEPTTPIAKHKSPISQPPDEPVSSAPSDNEAEKSQLKAEKKRKRKSALSTLQTESEPLRPSSPSVVVMSNRRHLLRGRHIQAKRMVLEDAKGLDQIFMR